MPDRHPASGERALDSTFTGAAEPVNVLLTPEPDGRPRAWADILMPLDRADHPSAPDDASTGDASFETSETFETAEDDASLETAQAAPDEAPDASSLTLTSDDLAGPLEAILLMATEPLSTTELAEALSAPLTVTYEALDDLRRFYDDTQRGFELREVGAGWRYYTRAVHHDLIARWVLEGQHGRLSQAALETLAVVAYLQPVARSRISAVRGVNVDGVLRTLMTRDLVEEGERDPDTGAMRFQTTPYFLERMGLTSLDELPPIAPFLPEASALEAELAGLANQALTSEDEGMSELINNESTEAFDNVDPDEIPTPEQVEFWEDAAENEQTATDGVPGLPHVPTEELDRLSDPE